MELQSQTKQFIENLQKEYGRTLSFPEEVCFLIDQTNMHRLDQPFRDAIFHAKFATKTREVMSRIGHDGEGYDKLSSEFQTSVEKASTLLKTIVKESPEEHKQQLVRNFFSLDQSSFSRLMKLFEDLSWIKNWEVDGKSLPLVGESQGSSRHSHHDQSTGEDGPRQQNEEIVRIRNGSSFALVLMLVFCLVDTPATVLGWGLLLTVVAFLVYIIISSNKLVKVSRSSF